MIDPLSFVAGSAIVIAGKIIYDVALAVSEGCTSLNPPPPPPPLPTPKGRTKIKIFVDDIESVLNCSLSRIYPESRPTTEKTKKEENLDRVPKLDRVGGFLVSAGDLSRIKLRPTHTKTADNSRGLLVNRLPICTDCMIQKDKLKHVYSQPK